jgi:hypothetical protein
MDRVREELCYNETDIFTEDDVCVILALCFENNSTCLNPFTKESIYRVLQYEGITAHISFNISLILGNEEYLTRVKNMILERRQSLDSSAPCLRIAAYPMTREQIDNRLGERPNLGLIFGAESIYFQDTVHGLQNDALMEEPFTPVNVLGVHYRWLTENGKETRRALLTDENGFIKDVLFERNVPLHAVQILHLPQKKEMEIHRQISAQYHKKNILQINPWHVSFQRADNKFMSYTLWKNKINTPASCLIAKNTSHFKTKEILEKFSKEISRNKIIVLPNQGTEGLLVRPFDMENSQEMDNAINYICEHILPLDDCLVRETQGNTFCLVQETVVPEYRPLSLRIHVAWDGKEYHAESGYVQISNNQYNPITSLSQGGKIIPLSEAFLNLYYQKLDKERNVIWEKYLLKDDDILQIKNVACHAILLVNQGLDKEDYLKFAGIDLLLEVEERNIEMASGKKRTHSRRREFNLTPIVLEINPRPAGLAHSYQLSIDKLRDGMKCPKLKISRSLFQYIRAMMKKEKVHA